MTDEQVVRTLAEFDGWTEIQPADRYVDFGRDKGFPPPQWYRERGIDQSQPRRRSGDKHPLPAYLTSYDALAPVWRKLDTDTLSEAWEKLWMGPGGDGDKYAYTASDWFQKPPRDHAHALATAIKEAQR